MKTGSYFWTNWREVHKESSLASFSLLYRYPAFGRFWVGRSISLFGDAFTLIALPGSSYKSQGQARRPPVFS